MSLSPFSDLAFCGTPLDRADELRRDPAAIASLRLRPDARFLVMDALRPAFAADHDALLWLRRSETPDGTLIFLGLDADGAPRFAVDGQLSDQSDQSDPLGRIVEAREAAVLLSPADSAIVAQARSLLDWHRRNGFCASFGTPTHIDKAGYSRQCHACSAEHFPRVDPVVIMLAEHDGRVLVGRGVNFPANLYSALAGFVEPGESLEDAVARELHEEAGITVDSVRMVASQPWPFPASLMIGAHARAIAADVRVDTSELSDVRWVTRAEVAAALAGRGDWIAPPPIAIANRLLRFWVAAAAD